MSDSPTERALQLLALLARAAEPMSARAMAEALELPLSTAYRHLQVLKKWDWVQEHARTGLYEPGPMSVQLAHGFDQHSWLMQAARPELEALSARTGESAGLLCCLHGHIVCLDLVESQHALRCSFVKGVARSTVRGASAKALLAHLPEALVQPLLAEALAESGNLAADDSLASFMNGLQQIRERGYAVSEHEVDQGVWGVSAPVLLPRAQLIATVSLMAPSQRAGKHITEWIQQTCLAADRIRQRLLHR